MANAGGPVARVHHRPSPQIAAAGMTFLPPEIAHTALRALLHIRGDSLCLGRRLATVANRKESQETTTPAAVHLGNHEFTKISIPEQPGGDVRSPEQFDLPFTLQAPITEWTVQDKHPPSKQRPHMGFSSSYCKPSLPSRN